ncbi:MAG: pseudouridine synthase [Gammaproteobacteria bacterium]|nr:pseudouridine synthase [Gammaproteobacteria bacterium]
MFNYLPPKDTGLDILYEDTHLLVVNKPAGLLSVPGKGSDKQDCMISRAQSEYPQALITHRLDMATSGILVMALDTETHSRMSQLFQNRQVSKTYIAIVDGRPVEAEGKISLPLICDWPNRPRHRVDHELGKASTTLYKTLSYDEQADTSRIQLTPITGRTHQLRVHMQAIGHVILGDNLYADEANIKKADRLLLHASEIHFKHPVNEQPIDIHCPADF